MPEPRRFQRRGSFLIPAFETRYILPGSADDRTDDCAPSAQMILFTPADVQKTTFSDDR